MYTSLALDIGTTNWKAGLFGAGLQPLIRSLPVRSRMDESGAAVFDADGLWAAVEELVLGFPADARSQVKNVGITGMAEAGLLIDRQTGRALTPVFPWNHPCGQRFLPVVEDRFLTTGLPRHSKYSLFKILSLKESVRLEQTYWLGVPEYVLWKLTGVRQTDPTLAARTYAFDILTGSWDHALLERLGIPADLFAAVAQTGTPAGTVNSLWGLHPKALAAVCGHDHLCAAHALDALGDDRICLSAGTAQVMLGWLPQRSLTTAMQEGGLSYGPPPAGDGLVVLGSIQAAGGSANLWRQWLQMDADEWLAAQAERRSPSSLLYLPYTSGSGAPHMNPGAGGCLTGLRMECTRGEIARAVMEGVAWETRWILEQMKLENRTIIAAGGLARQESYMQLLSDALGTQVHAALCGEATLEGAAMLASHERWPIHARTYAPGINRNEWEQAYQRYVGEASRVLAIHQ